MVIQRLGQNVIEPTPQDGTRSARDPKTF